MHEKNKSACFIMLSETRNLNRVKYRGLFIGLTTIDIQYFVEQFPEPNKKVKTKSPDILVGGPAANAAVAFAHLNNGAFFASAFGNNSFDAFVREDFEETRVQFTDLIGMQKKNPVLASVITSGQNGDRNIFTHSPDAIFPELSPETLFEKARPEILLLDGFYPEFSLGCAQLARSLKIPVVLDCGSWKPQYETLLENADVVIASEDFYPPGCKNSADVFSFFSSKGILFSAISRGSQNMFFNHCGSRGELPVKKVSAVDSLGAGDFLHGAFCYYYLEAKLDFEKALKQAMQLATFTCQFKGTRSWLNFTK